MISGKDHKSDKSGRLLVAFSDDDGSSVGVEFAATTQRSATTIMGICASTFGSSTGRLVTSSSSGDTSKKSSDGGDNMERRIAVLETEVSHIKSDVSDLKKTASSIEGTVHSIDKNMAVIMVKLDNITDSLSKKPSTDAVEKKISDAKLAVLLGVPAIIAIGTGIYKAIAHFLNS